MKNVSSITMCFQTDTDLPLYCRLMLIWVSQVRELMVENETKRVNFENYLHLQEENQRYDLVYP